MEKNKKSKDLKKYTIDGIGESNAGTETHQTGEEPNDVFRDIWTLEDQAIPLKYCFRVAITEKGFWITGEANMEEEWDWYLQELEKLGLPEIHEIYQKHHDLKVVNR
jgi:hypothetical protein